MFKYLMSNRTMLIVGSALVLSSCSRFSHSKKPAATAQAQPAAPATASNQEDKLRHDVSELIKAGADSDDATHAKLIKKDPYYFKEYEVYPDGPDGYTVDIQAQESRTTPYSAVAKMNKLRFVTKMHRKREDAQADNVFFRDTGSETVSYEFRNGRWWRIGSFYMAQKTEENVNGEWVAVQEQAKQTVASEEEQKGWFDRAWSAITGK